MCLAIPMEVVKIENENAWVSAGGIEKEVRLDLIDEMPEIGDYVIVHAGFAIQIVDPQAARQTLDLLNEIK